MLDILTHAESKAVYLCFASDHLITRLAIIRLPQRGEPICVQFSEQERTLKLYHCALRKEGKCQQSITWLHIQGTTSSIAMEEKMVALFARSQRVDEATARFYLKEQDFDLRRAI
eukprot:scaffold196963_cov18-Tisochrysis_lutea.AAC.2